jgi:HK97 family phage major capsid protein
MATGILTTSATLPKDLSDEIFANVQDQSAIMQLATPIELPGRGMTIPVVTGDPEASFTAEGEEAKVSNTSLGVKEMKPYKLTVIELFSNEFKDNYEAIFAELQNRLPGAIGRKVDATIMYGTAPGTGFDTLADAESVDLSVKPYDGFVDALEKVSNANGDLNGWVLSPKARTLLLKAKDSQQRPLFITNPAVEGKDGGSSVLAIPSLFSRAAYQAKVASKTPELVGVGGDWTGARFGLVKDIAISMADQATINAVGTTMILYQRDMFALKCTFMFGFVARDKAQFVRLANGTAA